MLENRKQEMTNLRMTEKKSLQEIATIYGLSRERVRQIIGNTGDKNGGFRISKVARLMHLNGQISTLQHLSNDELLNKFKMSIAHLRKVCPGRAKQHHAIRAGNGPTQSGFLGETIVCDLLKCKGFAVTRLKLLSPFDLLINDKIKIDVKSTFAPQQSSPLLRNPQWRFQVKKKARTHCDFYICIIVPLSEFFIIPADIVPEDQESIFFTWPTARPEIGKYQKYHEQWELLKLAKLEV